MKLALVSHFVEVAPHPTIDVDPVYVWKGPYCPLLQNPTEALGHGADPDQEKWSLPDPFGTLVKDATSFGNAPIGNKRSARQTSTAMVASTRRSSLKLNRPAFNVVNTSPPFKTK